MRNKVQRHARILRLEYQTAKTEQILNRPALALVYFLKHPKVHTFVLVRRQYGFFDAVNATVGYDDDVQEIAIETYEKLKLDRQQEQQKEHEHEMARGILFNADNEKSQDADYDNYQRQQAHLYKRPKHPNPMLPERGLECFPRVFAWEVSACRRIMTMRYHKKRNGKTIMKIMKIA